MEQPSAGCSGKAAGRLHGAAFALGLVLLAVCAGSALMLALEHLVGLTLPGCGAGSPCARASESVWGKVPYVDWPVSYLGLAYFLGLLLTWLSLRHGVPAVLRTLVRIGVLLSLGFVVLMIRGDYLCPYCLATHLGNFGFWILVELAPHPPQRARRPLLVLVSVFVASSVVLGGVEWRTRRAALAVAEAESRVTGQAILAAATRESAEEPAVGRSSTSPARESPTPIACQEPAIRDGAPGPAIRDRASAEAASDADTATTAAASTEPAERGFTGRYRLGPALTTTRIVIFMDYQCKGCHLLELELKAAFEKFPEISISVKQWPGDPECNPYSGDRHHVGACAAARAAEAAGLLGGNDAFWAMHFWLFDHNGRFTADELRAAVEEFKLDPLEFQRVMEGDQTRQLIQADLEEGFALGLRSTPMVFVNGLEFRGWSAPLTMTRLIEQLAQKKLTPRTAEADHPLPAHAAFIADWRASPARELPAAGRAWPRGPAEAALTIVMWGDYQQPNTALADGIIRDFLTGHSDALYTFHGFPLNPDCNPATKEIAFPLACRAAQAAQAAGELGGSDGYWKMHDWLLKHQAGFSDEILRAVVVELGLEPTAFFAALESADVGAAIAADAKAGEQLGLQHSPLLFINGKLVPRWLHGSEPLLRPILDAAAGEVGRPEPQEQE